MADQTPFIESTVEPSQTRPLAPQSTANQWSQNLASTLIAGPPSQSQPHVSGSTNQPSQAFLLTAGRPSQSQPHASESPAAQPNQIVASLSTAGQPNQCQIPSPSHVGSQKGSVEKPKIEQTMLSGDKVCSIHSKTPFSSVTY